MLGQLILNVDAAFSEEENTGACGAIIRDSSGMFVGAATAKLEHVADVVSAEAAAWCQFYLGTDGQFSHCRSNSTKYWPFNDRCSYS